MKNPTKKETEDYQKFFLEEGDPNFSPQRNKAVVEGSIKKYEAMRAKKWHEFDDAYAERSDAVISYLRALDRGGASSRLDHYFGEQTLRMLRGDDIRAKIHEGVRLVRQKNMLKGRT